MYFIEIIQEAIVTWITCMFIAFQCFYCSLLYDFIPVISNVATFGIWFHNYFVDLNPPPFEYQCSI